jgi:prepilin-type N-terminal cleavage/methylation domain-containing protein
MNPALFKKVMGFTLIELLVVLAISSILITALYRTFVSQQKIYSVQEQVVDMQQNINLAMGRMTRELRMAGYGGNMLAVFGNVNGFTQIITPSETSVTLLMADEVGVLTQNATKGNNQVVLQDASSNFNTQKKKYLCLNRQNNYVVQSVSGNLITLATPLAEDHVGNEPVYLVKAITYGLGVSGGKTVLQRNENTGGGSQPLTENMELLKFTYYDTNGMDTTNPPDIRLIRVTTTAKTGMSDPELKREDGFRKRTLACNIRVRNMGL